MKKWVLFFSLMIVLFFSTEKTYAFTIYESYGSAIKQTFKYVASKDYYYADLYDKTDGISSSDYVMYAHYKFYTDEFQTLNTEKLWSAEQEGYSHYIASVINCNGFYETIFYDRNMNQIGYVKMETTEIKNPPCDSSVDFEDQFPDDERNGGNNDCICLGIQELKDVTKTIRDSIGNEVLPELNSIKQQIQESNNHLLTINSSIDDFHEEFKTDKSLNIPDIPEIPSYLEPETNTYNHSDNNIYFEEPNYDEVPPPLPLAPEPKHWPGFLPEEEMEKEQELDIQKFTQDEEMQLQKFLKDEEFQLQQFTKDQEFNLQQFSKDEEFQLQDFDLTNQFNQNHFYERTEFYEQTWP